MQLKDFAKNKKTYAVVGIGLILGVIQGLDDSGTTSIHIPSWVNWGLGFLGLGALRMGVQASAENSTQQFMALFNMVSANLETTSATQVTAENTALAVAATPAYKSAVSEEMKTDLLNKSQLKL